MNPRPILSIAVLLSALYGPFSAPNGSGNSASVSASNSQSPALARRWKYLFFPFPETASELKSVPFFLAGHGDQPPDDLINESRGFELHIMNLPWAFFKTNAITARLHMADGTVVEPTSEGKRLLKAPCGGCSGSFPGEIIPAQVATFFPWGTNALMESWIEVVLGPERYWLEIPYGFYRNPNEPLPPSLPGGPPRFVTVMKPLTEHDHVVRWQKVQYDLGRTQNSSELSLIQSNPFDARSEVDLYSDQGTRNVYSPLTAVRIRDADGRVINGQCVNIHLDDNHLRRTDTFDFGRHGNELRCWGEIEIKVDDKDFRVVVPSSLYKYTHGHAPLGER